MKKAIVLCLSDPSSDPRPRRFIELLNLKGYIIDIYGYHPKDLVECHNYFTDNKKSSSNFFLIIQKIKRLILILLRSIVIFDSIQRYFNKVIHNTGNLEGIFLSNNYDLIIIEDIHLLQPVIEYKKSGVIIFDAREYYTRQNEESAFFRIFEKPERQKICKNYLKECNHILTVSNGLAKAYEEEFLVKTSVFLSCPDYLNIDASIIDSNVIKMVHHGVANPNRQIEKMIEIVKRLDSRFIFDIYLTGSPSYIDSLKKLTVDCHRICIKEPLEFKSILTTINNYDVGFFYVEPMTFNLKHCLPNKFFEFIQARLAIAIGPSPEMRDLVEKYDCGIISENFTIDSMVKELSSLTPQIITKLKNNSNFAAKALCFSSEAAKIDSILTDKTK